MTKFQHPYEIDAKYAQSVAYFCMEFGIDQALKIYSGGLGYLAGSHMRSAYALRQNVIGIGLLWKFGYYDQVRRSDGSMGVLFLERHYSFLKDTGIELQVDVHQHPVYVRVFYLPPEVFGTAPLFLLSTDHPKNDHLAKTITHRLYDSNVATKVAQYIVLGVGGMRLLDELGVQPATYHFNEAHPLPGAYALYSKYRSLSEVRKRLVVTTHTPIPAGNEVHDFNLLFNMGFFDKLSADEIADAAILDGLNFNQTHNALFLSRIANGVSKMHGEVARQMWDTFEGVCPITSITNAQNFTYWADHEMYDAVASNASKRFFEAKRHAREALFEVVADQCGKLFDPDICTLVWARRFAAYKRADLLTRDMQRFEEIVANTKHPLQVIWAGKPYPSDEGATGVFNHLVSLSRKYDNCAVLTGYELKLSKLLKNGSDLWLNTPRITREASGTSGMTAAMNGSINLSTYDGWIPEYAEDGINAFIIPPLDPTLPEFEQDDRDMQHLYSILEQKALPRYYDKDAWWKLVRKSMQDIIPYFNSDRMAEEYYETMYKVLDEASIFRNAPAEASA